MALSSVSFAHGDLSFSVYPMEADGTLVDEIVPILKILRDLHVRFLLVLVDGPV